MKREQEQVRIYLKKGLNFSTSEARKNFNITASADRRVVAEQLGRNRGVIGEKEIDLSLAINEK